MQEIYRKTYQVAQFIPRLLGEGFLARFDNFHNIIEKQAAKIKELEQEMIELRATHNLDW
jgi:hypothetical protein